MAVGGQASEISCSIPEMELNVREWQPFYQQNGGGGSNGADHCMLNGREVISREESSIQEPFACQLVNGQQQQPRYQQSAEANELNYPTQEMGPDTSQRQVREVVPYPIQETGPVAERAPDEHEYLPQCHQQLNGADINRVSSTGEKEQAVEHTCGRQELQLWRQESARQANVKSATFVLEIKHIVKYPVAT